jgi:hypothetical protein
MKDREVCRSPRGARSLSAFCSERDGDYADRVFAFADLVLTLLKQQSRWRYAANGFAFVPQSYRVPVPSHAASTGREKHSASAVALKPLF